MPRVSNLSTNGSVWLRNLAVAFFASSLCLAAGGLSAYAQFGQRDRILQPIDDRNFSVTSGNLHPSAKPQFDMGQLAPDTKLGRVTIFFNRTPQQESDLQTLLAEQQDRSSPNYHRWLTPEDFAARFGLSQGDVDKIVAWLQAQGLTIEQVSRSRTWVAFSGTAQQVGAALQTDLHRYAVGGETHFAMTREPSVPNAIAGMVLGFRGLDDFRLKPRAVKVQSRFTSGQSGNHFLGPGDVATIYSITPLYNAGVTGSGAPAFQIAVAGQSAIAVSDVEAFQSASKLPIKDPTLTPVSPAPGMVFGDIDEANLDVDWTSAVAPGAKVNFVYSTFVENAVTAIIDQNLAPVLSLSYGLCEDPSGAAGGFSQSNASALASQAQQANAQGMTIVAPAGDAGAADCDSGPNVTVATQGLAVDLPGALPYVTSVGGTAFFADVANPNSYWSGSVGNEVVSSALSYIPETSWNETDASGLAATGGGSSAYFPKPSWQTGSGIPNDGARDVPDISFNASGSHDPYIACSEDRISVNPDTFEPTCENGFRRVRADPNTNGTIALFGGTSTGVPVFAGIVALINQKANSPAGQGNVNPHLYAMANAASRNSFFNDVASGNNAVPFQPANLPECPQAGTVALGYVAGLGYDLVTGLGSINAYNLVNQWTSVNPPAVGASASPNFQLAISPATLTIKRVGGGGACGSVRVVLTPSNGFAGTPVFTCAASAPLTAVTCSVSPVASVGVPMPEKNPANRWWPLGMVVLAVCFWAGAFAARQRWHRRTASASPPPRVLAPGLALAGVLALAIGCGGSGSGNTPITNPNPTSSFVFIIDAPANSGTGTVGVTVTGTIGGVSRSTAMTLTVTN